MKDLDKIRDLYFQYGFSEEEYSEDYIVFSLPGNIYPGVDILADDEKDQETLKKKYAEINFSTNIVKNLSLSNIDLDLYKRFLRPQFAKRILKNKYHNYIDKVQSAYEDKHGVKPPYKYIESDYKWEKNFKPHHEKGAIITDISNLLLQEGPKLIIVEAAAGFGKTSTSYELLKTLCDNPDNRRPFLMELERDRQASTFHYLLISQIDRSFEVALKNNIVVDNIKKGRIPLIVDGFDELLSKDLDSGKESISFTKVETMLSTIAKLLVDNTKVILTTRKTAIFSEDEFQDWADYQKTQYNRHFTIDRFQLMESRPENWLSKDKLRKLPDALSKLSNPVILSYLRYSDILDSEEPITGSALIRQFFTSLLTREKTRQQLPLKISEQEEILRSIALYFSLFDITADKRTSLKNAIFELKPNIITENIDKKEESDELLNKLVNHALLDRHENGLVGFLNDFIYGSFLAKALLCDESTVLGKLENISNSNLQRIIEASAVLDHEDRKQIAHSLFKLEGISSSVLFRIEYQLKGQIDNVYADLYIENVKFSSLIFGDGCKLKDLQFIQCDFDDCMIDLDKIQHCTFINCEFGNSIFEGGIDTNEYYDCKGTYLSISKSTEDEHDKNQPDLDSIILSKFLRLDKETTRIRKVSSILRELHSSFDRKTILKHLDRLKSQRLIYVDGDNAWILQAGTDHYKSLINHE